MNLSQLEFGALLTYAPRGDSPEIRHSKDVMLALKRDRFVTPSERPTAAQHYESMSVQGSLSKPDEILLVDDVVTRGATLLGAANRLADAFPQSHIRAFAAMRTISNQYEFENVYAPCVGTIDLWESGDTFRRP